jgi:hypothetical protein
LDECSIPLPLKYKRYIPAKICTNNPGLCNASSGVLLSSDFVMHHRTAHFALRVKQNQKQNIKKSKQISIFREKKESTNGRNRKKHSPNSSQNKKKRF